MSDIKEKKENPIVKYFKGVRSEFKKITWPTLKQIQNNTGTVVLAVIIVGIFIFVLDSAFGFILKQFIK
jgi:preprotein translocase subunit SecE